MSCYSCLSRFLDRPKHYLNFILDSFFVSGYDTLVDWSFTMTRAFQLKFPLAPGGQVVAGISEAELKRLATVLDGFGLQCADEAADRRRGRPKKNRTAMARSLAMRALLSLPSLAAMLDLFRADPELRRVCGWQHQAEVPSCATFSRALPEILVYLPEPVRTQVAQICLSKPWRRSILECTSPPAQKLLPPNPLLMYLRDVLAGLVRHPIPDLSLRQFATLLVYDPSSGLVTARSLARRLEFGSAGLKASVDRLDRLGLIQIVREPYAGRRYRVQLSRKGTVFLNELFASARVSPSTTGVAAEEQVPCQPQTASANVTWPRESRECT